MHVGVLLFHRVGDLDAAAPVSLVHAAGELGGGAVDLSVSTVARSRASVQTAADLTITPAWAFASAPEFDVIVVPGGAGVAQARGDDAVRGYLARQGSREGVRFIGISSGVLLLGDAGLLRGRRVAAHREIAEHVRSFEVLDVVTDETRVDGPVWSAPTAGAGVGLVRRLLRTSVDAELADAVDDRLGLS